MKRCCTCELEKPEEEFYRHTKHGRQGKCIKCSRAYYNEWIARKIAETGKRPYAHKQRGYHLKHHYGLTESDVPNKCQICGSDQKICVDHDHQTGRVRGFLCDRCNIVLGRCEDDPNLLRQLADYLEK